MLLVCTLNAMCALILVVSFGFFLWALGVTLFPLMKVVSSTDTGLEESVRISNIWKLSSTLWNSQLTALYGEYLV